MKLISTRTEAGCQRRWLTGTRRMATARKVGLAHLTRSETLTVAAPCVAGTSITVGGSPRYIAITPDGRTAYVVNEGAGSSRGSVTPITLASGAAGKPRIGLLPEGVVITAA